MQTNTATIPPVATNTATIVAQPATKEEKPVRKDTVVSTATADAILTHIKALHGLLWDWGQGNPLPASFDDVSGNIDRIETVLSRAKRSLEVRYNADKSARVAHLKGLVAKVVESATEEAKSAKVAYEALPASVRKHLPAFDGVVRCSMTDLGQIFKTSNASIVVKGMQDLGYKIDGRSVGKAKDIKDICLPLDTK